MPLDIPEVIDEAIGMVTGEQASGHDVQRARRAINLILAEWQNRGLRLWKVSSGSITTVAGTASYATETDLVDILDVTLTGADARWLTRISRSDYERRDFLDTAGTPSQFYLDRQKAPRVFLFPEPDAAFTVEYHYVAAFTEVANGGDTLDMPDRFIPALIAGMAHRIAVGKPQVPAELRRDLKNEYEQQFNMARIEDRERTPTQFHLTRR